MFTEHSAGAIIFKKVRGEFLFLLLHYEEGHWGAAKGHVEKGESLEQTTLREIREETSLIDLRLIPGFKTENHYFYKRKGELSNKTVTFFLAEALSGNVKLSLEHVEFAWLPFSDALEKVTFKSEKEVWQAAYDSLITS